MPRSPGPSPCHPAAVAVTLAIAIAAGLLGAASAQPPDEPPRSGPPLERAEALAALEKEIQSRSGDGRFSGVVLVAKEGEPVLTRAAGLAQREHGVPARDDTKFNLGSINKVFTRLAILQLVEAGKLDLDAPLARSWPDYPNREIAAKVTVRQLLDMQAGVPDVFNERFDATPKDRRVRWPTTWRSSWKSRSPSSRAPSGAIQMAATSCSAC